MSYIYWFYPFRIVSSIIDSLTSFPLQWLEPEAQTVRVIPICRHRTQRRTCWRRTTAATRVSSRSISTQTWTKPTVVSWNASPKCHSPLWRWVCCSCCQVKVTRAPTNQRAPCQQTMHRRRPMTTLPRQTNLSMEPSQLRRLQTLYDFITVISFA